MAMTKKEKAAMQALIDRAERLAALRWTEPVSRDVDPPSDSESYSEGWDYNAHSRDVWFGWSGFSRHGTGSAPSKYNEKQASSGSHSLYSNKLLALKAMRHEIEMNCAKILLAVDREIEKEK